MDKKKRLTAKKQCGGIYKLWKTFLIFRASIYSRIRLRISLRKIHAKPHGILLFREEI